MNYLILANPTKDEFCYQALDYYRLLEGFLEPKLAEGASEYVKEPRIISLNKARALTILAFRPLSFDEIKSIHEDNTVICFSSGELHPSVAITGRIFSCFIAFGHRSAYRIANQLKIMNINRPVYRVMPWVDVEGIKQYDAPPLGKITGEDDLGLRSMFRLMAAGAVVVAPNKSPFIDVILNGWNGVVYTGDDPDFLQIGEGVKEGASEIVSRAKEFVNIAMDKTSYINNLKDVIGGRTHDYNEPWIDVRYTSGSEWIILKETMESGELATIPKNHSDRLKIMKSLTLEQLLSNFTSMRFKKVYVFDSIVEEMDAGATGRVNRLLSILGTRAEEIVFCFDPPEEWKSVSSALTFLPPQEAAKQVL